MRYSGQTVFVVALVMQPCSETETIAPVQQKLLSYILVDDMNVSPTPLGPFLTKFSITYYGIWKFEKK